MSQDKISAEEYYNNQVNSGETEAGFTKLTSTGISSDYQNVFDFAEAFAKDQLERACKEQREICVQEANDWWSNGGDKRLRTPKAQLEKKILNAPSPK